MYKLSPLILLIVLCLSCSQSENQDSFAYESANLKLKQLSENSWIHISYLTTESYGKVPCNGLVYANQGEAIVFDTPASDSASIELLNFFKDKGITINKVVPTHFHYDCLGGLTPFHNEMIASESSIQTFDLAVEAGDVPVPKQVFEGNKKFAIGSKTIEFTHFGAGHTLDNMVVYVPAEELLFGGCLVKTIKAGKGNLADADTLQWSNTIQNILNAYPNLRTVVPGHGKEGDTELLEYTANLFQIK